MQNLRFWIDCIYMTQIAAICAVFVVLTLAWVVLKLKNRRK